MKKQSILLFFLCFALTIQANPTHSWLGQAKSYFSTVVNLFGIATFYEKSEDMPQFNSDLVTSHHWIQDHQDRLLSKEIKDIRNRRDALEQDINTLSEYNSKLTEEWTTCAGNLRNACNNLQNESTIIKSFLKDYDHAVKSYAKTSEREDYVKKLRQNLRDEVRTKNEQYTSLTKEFDRVSSLQSSLMQSILKADKEIIKTRAELNTLFSKKDINLPGELKNVEALASYNTSNNSCATASANRLNRIKRKLNVGDSIL